MGIRTIDGEVDCSSYSPSNLPSVVYFMKVEYDIILSIFFRIFSKNGNNWEMDKERFNEIIQYNLKNVSVNPGGLGILVYNKSNIEKVYQSVFIEEGEKLVFRKNIIKHLLVVSRKSSLENFKKQTGRKVDKLLSLSAIERYKINLTR